MSDIQNYEEKKRQKEQAQAPVATAPPPPSVQQDLSVIENAATIPVPTTIDSPVRNVADVEKIRESQRNNHMQSFGTWAEAAKDGRYSQQEWANAKIQQMVANGQNPGEFVNMLSIYGEAESPQEKERRERREALGETFRGLGSLIGNAANLYYASKGATPVDLTSVDEKHRARMEQIKAKNDVLDEQRRQILAKAKLGELQAERAERAAKAKADSDADAKTLEFKRDVMLKEIDNAFRIGQIDAQTAADLKKEAAKLKTSKQMEDYRQVYREALAERRHEMIMEREDARGGGSRATIRVPKADGSGYDEYRKNDLNNPIVVSQIYHSLPAAYRSEKSAYEALTLIEMQAAIGKAQNDGVITEIAPEIKVNGKGESLGLGIGTEDNDENKLGIGI